MEQPKVSILVPVYGVEKFIGDCAESLFSQTYENLEYIFVDDCTEDRSIEVLKEIAKRFPDRVNSINIIRHEQNRGLAAARNTGVANATGDYIVHVDSDDWIEKDAISLLMAKAIKENADVVIGNFRRILGEECRPVKYVFPKAKEEILCRYVNWASIPPSICGKLIKRKLYTENNITAIEGVNYAEDFAVTPRLFYFANKIVAIDDIVYNYVCNPTSYTQLFKKNSADNFIQAANIVYDFYRKQPDFPFFEKDLMIGRAKIKCQIILRIGRENRNDYREVFPELNSYRNYFSIFGLMKLFFAHKGMRIALRIMNKISKEL